MKIGAKTPAIDLWRLLWTHREPRDDKARDHREAAQQEWAHRMEVFEHEHGAGTSAAMEDQYAAYVQGREDELAIRGDDIDVARRLWEFVERSYQRANPGSMTRRVLGEVVDSLTLRERMRLEGRT